MGRGYWDDKDWMRYSKAHIAGKKSVDDIFTSKCIDPALDPKGIKTRESCDSIDNPNSTALIVGLDVTGSMGCVLDSIAREGLKNLATEVYNRKPITNPHIMFLGIGDAEARDLYPLQATQFEADIRIAEQLTKIYLERGGGGNNYESYALAWYFAALHTKIDCFEKRKKKGFLFTIGDEEPTPYLRASDIERVMGYRPQTDYLAQDLLTMVSRQYEVYHLMIREGSYFRSRGDIVQKKWKDLLGQRAIVLDDYTMIGEVIVSTLQIANGENPDAVIKSWDSSKSLVVANAIKDLTSNFDNTAGVVRF